MTIGARLREERERLGLSQPKFAALANTTKQTLFSWEQGKTAPDGFQIAALATAGVDILYVFTGQRSQPVSAAIELPARQRALLDNYTHMSEEDQAALERTASALAQPKKRGVRKQNAG